MFFPFMADVGGQVLVLIGGGKVAFRKFELFRDFGAQLRVVAPELSPLFSPYEGSFEYRRKPYGPEDLEGAFAVVAAAGDRGVNRAAAEECRRRRVPVNAVDDPEACTFIVPAVLRRGDLTVAGSTGGKSPALAGAVKRELAGTYGEEYGPRLELLGRLRDRVKEVQPDPGEHKRLLTQAAAWDVDKLKKALEEL